MSRRSMTGAQIRAALARHAAEAAAASTPPDPPEPTSPEPSPEPSTPKRRGTRPSKKEQ